MKIDKRQPLHWNPVREERNHLLDITDRYMMTDRLNDEQLIELKIYRQALRDLTNQSPAANQIVWPIPPVFIKEITINA